MKQRYTSRQTSINSKKAPAVYSMPKAIDIMTGKSVVDIGGGRFDTAQEDRPPPIAGKKTGVPLIIWTKSPPLSRAGWWLVPGG